MRDLRPDLVILDIKMPGLDGLSAARAIAGDRLAAVLMVTAFSQRELVEQARDAGALAYLVKPFQKSDLIPAIEVALGRFAELTALEREVEDLQARLDARKSIDRAKGRLMDEHGLAEQDAWRFLQQQAMANRVKIDEIARRVIDGETHSLDPTGPRSSGVRSPLMSTLLLIDGLSLAYRAFYALPADLATPEGTITNAVYGFTSMLVKVLADEHPDCIAVVFDAPGPTFRARARRRVQGQPQGDARPLRAADPADPRGGRRAADPDAAGPRGRSRRRDRDARRPAPRPRASTWSSSPATATATSWCRDPHIKVLYNRRGVSDYALYDEAGIFERTGVTPAQYPEYAALRGDPSDNLPGVPGIGEKTAAKLVTTYGNLEGIFEHLDELPPKQRQNLGEARDRVFLNREMSLLRSTSTSTSSPPTSAGRVGPRAGARPLRPARVPHVAAAPPRGGGGEVAGDRGARCSTSRSTSLRDAAAVARRCSASSRPRASRIAVERALGRRARRQPACAALAHRDATTRDAAYVDATCSAIAEGAATRSPRSSADGGPPLDRAPGQGADARAPTSTSARCTTTPR